MGHGTTDRIHRSKMTRKQKAEMLLSMASLLLIEAVEKNAEAQRIGTLADSMIDEARALGDAAQRLLAADENDPDR